MKSPVHILVTMRKPELLPAALLVFKTLRTGFPSAPVFVWGNGLEPAVAEQVAYGAAGRGAAFHNLAPVCHDAWVEQLVLHQAQPFWICDTDVVFFDQVEWWFEEEDTELFAGRLEPTWDEPWSRSIHLERLHTALMWLNPGALRAAMLRWCREEIPAVFHTAQVPFIRQNFVPMRTGKLLYDTTAGLWQAGWGTPFTAQQNGAYEHLNCGTYADEVSKVPAYRDMAAIHRAICENPEAARGLQLQQNEFYESRRPAGMATNTEKG